MSYDITGNIAVIFDEMQVTATFKKREFVIEVPDDKYPEFIKFETTQDKCDLLNNISVGQEVAVSFNLGGRKWTDPKTQVDKYFNSHHAWKIEGVGQAQPQAAPPQAVAPPVVGQAEEFAMGRGTGSIAPPLPEVTAGGELEDDVPFNKLGDFEQ